MSKSIPSLTEDEIEEELVNNDLLNSGGVENDSVLNEMNFKEKQELLRTINQSKEEFSSESSPVSKNQSACDTGTSNFQSLPVSGKNKSEIKLKLPRKEASNVKIIGESTVEDNLEKSCSINNVLEKQKQSNKKTNRFNLPFCIDDGALPLPLPERPRRIARNENCVMKGENPSAALRRMLAEHNKWKAAYIEEIRRVDSHASEEEEEESDGEHQTHSPVLFHEQEGENDPYHFVSKSPDDSPKVYSSFRKRETKISTNETTVTNNRQLRSLQRKASRDSDCEELEPILKPAETKTGERIEVQKPKRNKKQSGNQEKGRPKSIEDNTDVQFEFTNKWDEQSSVWRKTRTPSSGTLNNQVPARRPLSNTPEVKEETVECPICQKRFPQSKVENHAATCEGYSYSPMDIEEN